MSDPVYSYEKAGWVWEVLLDGLFRLTTAKGPSGDQANWLMANREARELCSGLLAALEQTRTDHPIEDAAAYLPENPLIEDHYQRPL